MRRREFLGVAGAGVLGALWRPKGTDVATDSSWTKSLYGTDLDWAVGTDYSSLVTVGNGTAYLIWRRMGGVLYYLLGVIIGSTTSIPAGSPWLFELPDVFSNVSDTNVIYPKFIWSGAGGATVAAASDTGVDVSASAIRPGYNQSGFTNLPRPSLVPYAPSFDTGSGLLSKTFPATWAAGDYFSVSGWAPCLDN